MSDVISMTVAKQDIEMKKQWLLRLIVILNKLRWLQVDRFFSVELAKLAHAD